MHETPSLRESTVGPAAARRILLSFDLEECDIPLEYGTEIPLKRQLEITACGLSRLRTLLDRLAVRATFFTTAVFAAHYAPEVEALARRHEIASHGYRHGVLDDRDLIRSRRVLRSIAGQSIRGFRAARMDRIEHGKLCAAGYRYCASGSPTWIPGRYNDFFAPRTPCVDGSLVIIPASVTPLIRFPMFWLSVKNLPMWWLRAAARWILAKDGHLSLYFHPWEFADLSGLGLPRFVTRRDGQAMLDRLEGFLVWLRGRAGFTTYEEFAEALLPSPCPV